MINTCVFVLDKLGNKLMPTKRFSKVRHWLKNKQAKIATYKPFTIQLLFDTTSFTQPIEFSQDTGYLNIGNSIKSENHEYVSKQVIMLKDEKQRHDDCRMYRKTRRNRLRYRKVRFNNRRRKEGWLAPSLQHKKELHLAEIMRYYRVCPITDIYLEVGQFDTAKLKAIQTDRDIPEGDSYQKGDRYDIATLREAVFQKDKYQCEFCAYHNVQGGRCYTCKNHNWFVQEINLKQYVIKRVSEDSNNEFINSKEAIDLKSKIALRKNVYDDFNEYVEKQKEILDQELEDKRDAWSSLQSEYAYKTARFVSDNIDKALASLDSMESFYE